MADPAHVLVYDSGVGALSIISEIKQHLPKCSITYASDTAFFPYGNKEETELIHRVDHVLKTLEQRCAPDIIVVACNTASTVALPKIRDHFKFPTVGVVPAIRPAAQLSKSKVIGLLATPGTVERQYTKDLIQEFASDCLVISVGSSELVHQAEQKLRGQPVDLAVVQQVTSEVFNVEQGGQVDVMVLACTHFPHLIQELKQVSPDAIQWIDSGDAIARRVAYWIDELKLPQRNDPQYQTILTAKTPSFVSLAHNIETLLPGPIVTIDVD